MHPVSKMYKPLFILIILASGFWSCQSDPDTRWVARFNGVVITPVEFKNAYYQVIRQPQIYDGAETRERFLDELINRRLLANEAEISQLDTTEEFQFKKEAFLISCLKDAHYEAFIKPQLQINDSLVAEVHAYLSQDRHIQHLFYRDSLAARTAYYALQEGADWDSLARVTFENEQLKDSGGDLGWVTWEEMQYEMAMTAFRLPVDQISPPVRTTFGYHLLKVKNFHISPFHDPVEFARQRDHVSYLIGLKQGEVKAKEYIDRMSLQVELNPEVVQFTATQYNEFLNREKTPEVEMYSEDTEEPGADVSMWERRHDRLLTVNGEAITVGEFISYLPFLPAEVIRADFKVAMDYFLRDRGLAQEAIVDGLKEDPQVQVRSKLYNEFQLHLLARRQIMSENPVTPEAVRLAYENELVPKIQTHPFEEVESILFDYLNDIRRATLVPQAIAGLREKVTIEKNLDLMHETIDNLYIRNGSDNGV